MIRFLVLTLILLGTTTDVAGARPSVAANDVVWSSLGKNENDSMPVGNGDLAANVWTEPNGDLVLLVSKADAWSELNKPLKLGRIRVRLTPNPFATATDFKQTLRLEDATVEIRSGSNVIRVWVDANHPVLRVEGSLGRPSTVRASVELWRTKEHPYDEE